MTHKTSQSQEHTFLGSQKAMQTRIQHWRSKCEIKLDIQNGDITSMFLFEVLSFLFLSIINANYFVQQVEYDPFVSFNRNLQG